MSAAQRAEGGRRGVEPQNVPEHSRNFLFHFVVQLFETQFQRGDGNADLQGNFCGVCFRPSRSGPETQGPALTTSLNVVCFLTSGPAGCGRSRKQKKTPKTVRRCLRSQCSPATHHLGTSRAGRRKQRRWDPSEHCLKSRPGFASQLTNLAEVREEPHRPEPRGQSCHHQTRSGH